MPSAARRQIIGAGGAPINKSRRRRPQIVGGDGAARSAHGSTSSPSTLLHSPISLLTIQPPGSPYLVNIGYLLFRSAVSSSLKFWNRSLG